MAEFVSINGDFAVTELAHQREEIALFKLLTRVVFDTFQELASSFGELVRLVGPLLVLRNVVSANFLGLHRGECVSFVLLQLRGLAFLEFHLRTSLRESCLKGRLIERFCDRRTLGLCRLRSIMKC